MRNIKKITDGLIRLQSLYAFTPRKIITEERYAQLINSGLIKDFTYDAKFLSEPLIEHVGHLPIIASYLHPHIEHKHKVDLGRVLIMLSVHDIGETRLGDVFAFSKTKNQSLDEYKITKKILPKYLFQYFDEMERRQTFDAKFAKSVDSIAPILHEMPIPKVTKERFRIHNYDIAKIVRKKQLHFTWDKVLSEVFDYLIEKYRRM